MTEVKKASKDSKKGRGANEPRVQIPPIFKVVSGGITIDFTDKIQEATTVFREAYAKPKFIYSVNGNSIGCVAAQY